MCTKQNANNGLMLGNIKCVHSSLHSSENIVFCLKKQIILFFLLRFGCVKKLQILICCDIINSQIKE